MIVRQRIGPWVLLTLLHLYFEIVSVAASEPRSNDGQKPSSREDRFPSVEERIKIYMSNWYVPPCRGHTDGYFRYAYRKDQSDRWPKVILQGANNHPLRTSSASPFSTIVLENIIEPDQLFFLDRDIALECANLTSSEVRRNKKRKLALEKRVKFRINMRMYCWDVADSVFRGLDHLQWEGGDNAEDPTQLPPMLLQFGDKKESHVFGDVNVPHIKKFRSAVTDPAHLHRVTSQDCYSAPRDVLQTVHTRHDKFQPIVWKLATHRHFDKLKDVYRSDIPWSKKKDMAIFRGQLTGAVGVFNKTLSDRENCRNLVRCRLVYNHANSSLIDAKLTNVREKVATVMDGITMTAGKTGVEALLEYKGIIMIEGNDVASGLKWALLSQSVVLMPPPKHTSWAMEELLEPWVVSENPNRTFRSKFNATLTLSEHPPNIH